MTRAAVLGQPIAHSLSPVLHRAAYEALGLDWSYDAVEVAEGGLADFVASLGDEWVGLSLTMPLKVEAIRVASFVEPQAKLLGTANTLLASGLGGYRQWVAANTDVHGIVAALKEAGCGSASSAAIVGGGATAVSALAALAQLGATGALVGVRDRSRAGAVVRAATAMGLSPRIVRIESQEFVDGLNRAKAVVSTIPADAGETLARGLSPRDGGFLLDAVYSPLVTPLGAAWASAGGVFVNGTRMLLHQAAEQVRLMTQRVAPIDHMDAALAIAIAGR